MEPEDDFENTPDLDKVAYDVAVEAVASIYVALRGKGLGRMDAAAIVSYILKSSDESLGGQDAQS